MNAGAILSCAMVAAVFFKASSALSVPDHVLYKGANDTTGWEMQYSLTPSFAWRLSGHDRVGLHRKQKEYMRGIARFNNKSLSALLDWHPLNGSFRTSAGFFLSSQRADFFAEPDVDMQFDDMRIDIDKTKIPDHAVISDQTLDLSADGVEEPVHVEGTTIDIDKSGIPDSVMVEGGTLQIDRNDINASARVAYRQFSPYLGFGWGSAPYSDRRVRYSFDLGMIYVGRSDVSLELGGGIIDVDPMLSELLEEYVAAEEVGLQEMADKFRIIPYVSAGISFAF